MKWYEKSGIDCDVVLGTQVAFSRNLAGVPFVWRLDADGRQQVTSRIADAIYRCINIHFEAISCAQLNKKQLTALLERRLISPSVITDCPDATILLSDDESVAITILGEDHLRIVLSFPGRELEQAAKTAQMLSDALDSQLNFAKLENIGYIGPELSKIGSNLEFTTLVHLPAMTKNGELSSFKYTAGKLGFGMSEMFSTFGIADFLAFSNELRFGIEPIEAAKNLDGLTVQYATRERSLAEEKSVSKDVADNIRSALSIAREANFLSTAEMLESFSWIGIGITAGRADVKPEKLNGLVFNAQPATLGTQSGAADFRERDAIRAQMVKSLFN